MAAIARRRADRSSPPSDSTRCATREAVGMVTAFSSSRAISLAVEKRCSTLRAKPRKTMRSHSLGIPSTSSPGAVISPASTLPIVERSSPPPNKRRPVRSSQNTIDAAKYIGSSVHAEPLHLLPRQAVSHVFRRPWPLRIVELRLDLVRTQEAIEDVRGGVSGTGGVRFSPPAGE